MVAEAQGGGNLITHGSWKTERKSPEFPYPFGVKAQWPHFLQSVPSPMGFTASP